MRLQFLGATDTVTGSIYLLQHQYSSLLVDCGLFQGYKPIRLRNWSGCRSDRQLAELCEVINRTAARGGVVVIPAFAVGRAQSLLYCIHLLKAQSVIEDIPVYLNSPMATLGRRDGAA